MTELTDLILFSLGTTSIRMFGSCSLQLMVGGITPFCMVNREMAASMVPAALSVWPIRYEIWLEWVLVNDSSIRLFDPSGRDLVREKPNKSTSYGRSYDRFAPLTEAEKAKMREFLPYWKGKSLYDKWHAMVPEDMRKLSHYFHVPVSSCFNNQHLAHNST